LFQGRDKLYSRALFKSIRREGSGAVCLGQQDKNLAGKKVKVGIFVYA